MTFVEQIYAKTLFDGCSDTPLHDQLVTIKNGVIVDIKPSEKPALTQGLIDAEILAPGFIDLQINGAGDVMFNDSPTVETLEQIAKAASVGGTAYILPTFTTAPDQDFSKALSAVTQAIDAKQRNILGVHLEGPFLSPHKPGIHPPAAIRRMNQQDLQILLSTSTGARLITLASEEDEIGAIKQLTDAGWTVFAGHSNATHSDIQSAQTSGLSGATHLFNAMSQTTAREPGLVGATMNSKHMFAGIIVDGFHVHQTNIKMAYDLMGPNRLCLVTDAMPTLAGKSTEFEISGNPISLRDGRLVDKKGTLAGAHLSMDDAVRNIIQFLNISVACAIKMATSTPAAVLGLDQELGQIRSGYRASFTILDQSLSAQKVIIDGALFRNSEAGEIQPQPVNAGEHNGHD